MEDSRLPMRALELEAGLDEDMQYVASVSPGVWELLGGVCDLHGEELQPLVFCGTQGHCFPKRWGPCSSKAISMVAGGLQFV